MDAPPEQAARKRPFHEPDTATGKLLRDMLRHLRQAKQDREDAMQFVAFATAHVRFSKSQLFQDVWALWETGGKRGGYFVEFGGGDGEFLSNTWYLEKSWGWQGVVAEPHPHFAASLAGKRSCSISHKAVFSRSGEKMRFVATAEEELSRLEIVVPDDTHERSGARSPVGLIEVETISLADLLEEAEAPFEIDYMSIDTEGSELAILSAFDFSSRNIRCISVEHNGTPNRQAIHDLLTANGYRRKWPSLSAWDDWYVRK